MKKIPLHSLVITVGPPVSKKEHLARFADYEIISADAIRYHLVGDPARQDINSQVFNEVHRRTALKLNLGERVVIDALNLRRDDRVSLAHLGIQAGVPVFYLVCNEPVEDRLAVFEAAAVERHEQLFQTGERDILRGDGLAEVIDTRNADFEVVEKLPAEEVEDALLARGFQGVTVVGDVHGMYQACLNAISWARSRRQFILFVGDILDYGRQTLEVCDEVYRLVMRGEAELILGNHEKKILRWLEQVENGRVSLVLSDGNKVTTHAVEALSPNERRRWVTRFRGLCALSRHHRRIGNVLVVHGAAQPEMWETSERRLPRALEAYAMFGEVDRSRPLDEEGHPRRTHQWVAAIPKDRLVIVGHEIRSTAKPVTQVNENGGTAVFLDCGAGKGGTLMTADLVFCPEGLKLSHFNQH